MTRIPTSADILRLRQSARKLDAVAAKIVNDTIALAGEALLAGNEAQAGRLYADAAEIVGVMDARLDAAREVERKQATAAFGAGKMADYWAGSVSTSMLAHYRAGRVNVIVAR